MDWGNFQAHGQAPARAFEAFTGVLFERWIKRERALGLERTVYINGAGGDGGVESLAFYADGSKRGLQAKWFRDSLDTSRIAQIKRSITKALEVHPTITEYVVALPRDLAHPKRTITDEEPERVTERDRWDEMASEIVRDAPHVDLILWDESHLAELMAEFGSDGLLDYWFDSSVVRMEALRVAFEQARTGWLSGKYLPDLHTAGQIERDLSNRVGGFALRPDVEAEFCSVEAALGSAMREVKRLRRFSFFPSIRDGEQLVQQVLAALEEARSEQQWLARTLREGTTIVRALPTEASVDTLLTLINAIPPQNRDGIDSTREIRAKLQHAVEQWNSRSITTATIDELHRPVLYVGEPGSGKTHALAAMVERQLSRNAPALVVRARDLDASTQFESLLRHAVGEPTWSQEDILDACEASATLVQVRETAEVQKPTSPTRFLLAFDGLDESPNADDWLTRLGEVEPLLDRWPRVCFAFSLRQSLQRYIGVPSQYAIRYVNRSDADLEALFYEYTSRSHVSCPPVLRWALRTPLAIRLFAEVYEEQRVDFDIADAFTLEALIDKKLKRVEASLREVAPQRWDPQLEPVQRALMGLVREYVRNPRALTDEEATTAATNEQTRFASLNATTVGWILEKLRDYGLLLVNTSRSASFGPSTRTWEPAFEALTDFLLAHDARRRILDGDTTMPPFLRRRRDAATVTIALLGADGFDRLSAGLWKDDLSSAHRERLQRVALLHSPPHAAGATWAKQVFVRSMPSCRELLAELVVPSLRLPRRGLGGMFVHEVLAALTVQARDQFWSVPDYLPHNHDAPWEGGGADLAELLEIATDDDWDGMPLVAAWALTSCNNDLRRLLRRRIAAWAADKPDQLCQLLRNAGASNDPQMLEDLLWATYGASYLSEKGDGWNRVCDWINSSAAHFHAVSRWNVEIAHTCRAVIELCRRKGTVASDFINVPADSSLLPLDPEAAGVTTEPWRLGALDRDLIWYVVPHAYRPFFDDLRRLRHRRRYDAEVDIEALSAELLSLVANGSIRSNATVENRRNARGELRRRQRERERDEKEAAEQRARNQEVAREFAALSDEEQEAWRSKLEARGISRDYLDRTVEMFGKQAGLPAEVVAKHAGVKVPYRPPVVRIDTEDDFSIHGRDTDDIVDDAEATNIDDDDELDDIEGDDNGDFEDHAATEEVAASVALEDLVAAANDLLRAHADAIQVGSLTPNQFGLGYCQYRVVELGWDRTIHFKDPRGEKPGEVLGLDIAISRHYRQATHGTRSTISTMAEKYCWIARHELVGYLARRLAVESDGTLLLPPVDPGNFVETPSPATDNLRPQAQLKWPDDLFRTLAPPRDDIRDATQIEMANAWVTTTPQPQPALLLRAVRERLPEELRDQEWLVLQAFATREDPETMGNSVFWTSAFAVPQQHLQILIEDAENGLVDELQEFGAGLRKIETYSDPCEVVWAPWVQEAYACRRHKTVDSHGAPCEIELRALSCSFHWKHEEHEEELSMPSRWFIERLKITHVKNGRFRRADGTVVAVLDDDSRLIVRADLATEALNALGMHLCWGLRVYREPDPLLYSRGHKFARWNWYALGVYSDGGIDAHTMHLGEQEYRDRPRGWRKQPGAAETPMAKSPAAKRPVVRGATKVAAKDTKTKKERATKKPVAKGAMKASAKGTKKDSAARNPIAKGAKKAAPNPASPKPAAKGRAKQEQKVAKKTARTGHQPRASPPKGKNQTHSTKRAKKQPAS